MKTPFENLPEDARAWVYGLEQPLDAGTRERVAAALDQFVESWESHKIPVAGAWQILEDRFIVLAGYCTDGISGCSTDSSVKVIKALQNHFNLNALDRALVFFRHEDKKVDALSRVDFQNHVNSGQLGPGTPVFDTTIQTVGDVRSGRFETTFEKSWHAKAFGG